MRLDHTASVPAGRDDVWRFVNDVPAVVGCVPGAQVTDSVDESTYRGLVRISLGPLSLAYEGSLTVVDRDEDLRTLRMEAAGVDRRGAGSARAAITLALVPAAVGTRVDAGADVALTGPAASMTGVARAVSARLFADFAAQMSVALEGESSGRPPGTGRSRASVRVAPLLWSVARQRVAGYVNGLRGRLRP